MKDASHRTHLRAAAIGTCVGLSSLCLSARAEPSAEDKALATSLFLEGRALLARDELPQACRKFQESQRLDPSGGTLLNLAACHERLGRTASAWAEFNEALAWARRDGRRDRATFAAEHLRALEPRLSYIIVDVPQAVEVPGLQIRRNESNIRRPAWGARMPVDPGPHVIEAVAQGYRSWRVTLAVHGEGSSQRVSVPLLVRLPQPQSAAGAEPAASAPPSGEPLGSARDEGAKLAGGGPPWATYVLGGLGGVGVGVGAYFGLRAFSKDSAADDECPDGRCSAEGVRLNDEAGRAADLSTVAFTVGGLALGAGAVLWILAPNEPSVIGDITPVVGPQTAGVRWTGKF